MRNYQSYTDEELFDLLSADDEKSFETIYNRYWAQLFSNAFKRIKNAESASEIVQDVFTELWIHRHERKIHSSPAAYLHTAVRYRTLNQIEKDGVRARYRAQTEPDGPDSRNTTEEAIFLRELTGRLDKLISALPPQCRKVFILSRYEYKNHREIAAELNISEKTVENHITRALQTLRMHLGDLISFIWIMLLR